MDKQAIAENFVALLQRAEEQFFLDGKHPIGAVLMVPFEGEVTLGTTPCIMKFMAEITTLE
jgi:hypothetical protein